MGSNPTLSALGRTVVRLSRWRTWNPGGVAEWSNALVLKTSVPQGTGGSNPSPSAFSAYRLSLRRRPVRAQSTARLHAPENCSRYSLPKGFGITLDIISVVLSTHLADSSCLDGPLFRSVLGTLSSEHRYQDTPNFAPDSAQKAVRIPRS